MSVSYLCWNYSVSVMPHTRRKTMAAEAIGFGLGKPLLVVNVAELVSKWVGEVSYCVSCILALVD